MSAVRRETQTVIAKRLLLAGSVLTILLAIGWRVAPAKSERLTSVRLDHIPHVRQKPDFCGEACGEMVLKWLGYQTDQDALFDLSGLDPVEGRGCHTAELVQVLRQVGFATGPGWYYVDPQRAEEGLSEVFRELHWNLVQGYPSIVCMHYDDQPETTEHFRLIVGYDDTTNDVLYHEPAEANGAYRRIARQKLFELWPLKYEERRWTVICLALRPARRTLQAPPASSERTNADYAQHVHRLKQRLPDDTFDIVLQRPFVVVGDVPARQLNQHASGTVQWTVNRIKHAYFPRDPLQIIDIWLFKDRESYERNTKELFDHEPDTPFGYYSPRHRALVMNISTGSGTLCHEIVHPFMAANFPRCPAWFNEGLASLYEQCREWNGQIWGLPNWRLKALQEAIDEEELRPFPELIQTTADEFYNEDVGINYAQARYLCYYLQQQGKLVEFYRRFHGQRHRDPTGLKTLETLLQIEDWETFQEVWEKYVLQLKYD